MIHPPKRAVDKEPTREFYPLLFRLNQKDRWLIWFTAEIDGVWIESDGTVPAFDSLVDLTKYANERGILITDSADAELHDIDTVEAWLIDHGTAAVYCDMFLSVWNLFKDVATSAGTTLRERDHKARKVYQKLFWGNNLPAITPEGYRYEPNWTATDLVRMRQVLSRGRDLFRSRISDGPTRKPTPR